MKITTPKYYKIAVEIARQIADGSYAEGESIHARSELTSKYGVSSETARRAVLVLSDLDIIEVIHGSGAKVISRKRAQDFTDQYEETTDVNDLRQELLDCFEQHRQSMEDLSRVFHTLVEKTDRVRALSPFSPIEVVIGPDCPFLNKTLSEINFWHLTQATVVAIKHGDDLVLSPGPYAMLRKGDVLYLVGNSTSIQRAVSCLQTPRIS